MGVFIFYFLLLILHTDSLNSSQSNLDRFGDYYFLNIIYIYPYIYRSFVILVIICLLHSFFHLLANFT